MKKFDADEIRDIAINITNKLIELGYVKDCTDTDDEDEFEVQDTIVEVLENVLPLKTEETISVGVYYYIDNDGVYHFDEEEMNSELETKIKILSKKYNKDLEN